MKRNRIIFAILWVLSLIGISFFGGPVSYGFFALMTLIPIICIVYLIFVTAFFRIYQEIEGKNLVANHTAPFYFILKNEFPFGFSGIRVKFFSSFSEITDLDDGVEYELQPKTGIKKETQILSKYRGEYEVGIKTIEIRDFLCLFCFRFHNKETLRVIVKPAIVELSGLKAENMTKMMTREAQRYPMQPDVLVRQYENGDDVRMINWKSSARTGELLVRKTIGEEREGIGIILDTRRLSEEMKEYLPLENKMLETAIALSFFFTKKNIPVHACLAGSVLNGRGNVVKNAVNVSQFREMYEWFSATEFRMPEDSASDSSPSTNQSSDSPKKGDLAKTGNNTKSAFSSTLSDYEIYRCKIVFLIIGEWSADAVNAVSRLHESGVAVVVYLISNQKPESLPRAKMPNV